MNQIIQSLFTCLRRHEVARRRGPELMEANGRQTGFAGLHINADGSVLVLWHQHSKMFPSMEELLSWVETEGLPRK